MLPSPDYNLSLHFRLVQSYPPTSIQNNLSLPTAPPPPNPGLARKQALLEPEKCSKLKHDSYNIARNAWPAVYSMSRNETNSAPSVFLVTEGSSCSNHVSYWKISMW